MKNTVFVLWLGLAVADIGWAQNEPYKNPDLSPRERAEDLVKRLTLKEKASLMINSSPAVERLGIKPYNWWSEALPDISCIRSVGTPRVLCEYDFQPPGLQTFVGAFQERFVNLAGRGENNDTVTFLQIRRENKTTHTILSIYFGQKYTIHHRYHRLTRIFNRREGGYI